MEGKSYAIHSIVAAYALAVVPHFYSMGRMMVATGGKWSYAMPRTNMEAFKDKVPKSVWNHCLRARCAHFNALEGFPLFAAAMIAGTAAGLPTEDMNSSAAQYLGLRVLYTLYYIGVEDNFLALARTGVWGLSIAVPCWTLWKAGLKI